MGNTGSRGRAVTARHATMRYGGGASEPRNTQPPIGPYPSFPHVPDGATDAAHDAIMDRYYAERRAWESQMGRALSLGTITGEAARARGFDGTGSHRPEDIRPLPHDLYHVTTAADAVRRSGLKSRDELRQERGLGLGGGNSDTISFTTDRHVAEAIREGILEMRQVARGEVTPAMLLRQAEQGTGAPRPYLEDIARHWDENWQPGQALPSRLRAQMDGLHVEWTSLPRAVDEMEMRTGTSGWHPAPDASLILGGDGVSRYVGNWVRPATGDERREFATDFYKTLSALRDAAGGRMDPMFFLSDAAGLARVNPDQVQILHFHPRPGAMGYPVSGLGEWRTMAGDAVTLA